ncbi:MAG: hypothetical protein IKO28_01965 [Prevotella sp.]|nr:hypothetical protein [Prevotella sp.]
MKTVKAVAPYIYEGGINFKHKPYEAWRKLGGQVAPAHYPPRFLHGLAFRYELPMLVKGLRSKVKGEARLRFVEPVSLYFDTFPDYCLYEVIPFFWDVWPENFEKTFAWLKRHNTKTAIFTSSQVAEMVRARFPEMNVLAVTEGIDVENYSEGKLLRDREIDFLEYGRNIDRVVKYRFHGLNVLRGQKNGKNLLTSEQLLKDLQNSKVVAAYTKKWTNPELAGEIDTLTQRYWECMLSGCIMIGHAPQELVDLIGYNPVIEIDRNYPDDQLTSVLSNIADYQKLTDRNRNSAIKYGDWKYSMQRVMNFLLDKGYNV